MIGIYNYRLYFLLAARSNLVLQKIIGHSVLSSLPTQLLHFESLIQKCMETEWFTISKYVNV